MRTIDPDIRKAVELVFLARRAKHARSIRVKHELQARDRLETKLQLIADEVEEVLPKDHPAFEMVLALTVMEKLTKHNQEPEYVSCLEFPEGW